MKQYLDLCRDILENGVSKGDRTGTGTISVFGRQLRFNLEEGFPLLTTKKVHLRSIIHELLWFLKGSTNIKYLNDNNVTIWDEWADEHGELGPVYGSQWRFWMDYRTAYKHPDEVYTFGTIDQIRGLIDRLKSDPDSRRHMVVAWNPADVDHMALPPCHYAFQCYVVDGKLSLMFQMRSADVFLGVPFNIASYALLAMMIAQVTGTKAYELILTMGDTHIYNNHMEQIMLQLTREPKPLPKMFLNETITDIDAFTYSDFILDGYLSHPAIKGDISV